MSVSILDADLPTLDYLSKTPSERRRMARDIEDGVGCFYFIVAIAAIVLVCCGLKNGWFVQ